jgi:hypothetical protein
MTEPDDHQLMGITEISQLYFPGINSGRVSSVLLVIWLLPRKIASKHMMHQMHQPDIAYGDIILQFESN